MVYCQLQPRSVQTTPQGHSAEHWAATRFYTQHLVVRFDCPDLVSLLGSHLAQQTASAAILHQCKRRSHHLSRQHRQRTCFDLEVAVCCRKTPSSLQPCHLRQCMLDTLRSMVTLVPMWTASTMRKAAVTKVQSALSGISRLLNIKIKAKTSYDSYLAYFDI